MLGTLGEPTVLARKNSATAAAPFKFQVRRDGIKVLRDEEDLIVQHLPIASIRVMRIPEFSLIHQMFIITCLRSYHVKSFKQVYHHQRGALLLFSTSNNEPTTSKKKSESSKVTTDVSPVKRRLRLPRLINDETTVSTKAKPVMTRILLGSNADVEKAEMNERLESAQKWESKQLSDDEADILNRALGIDKEILDDRFDEKRKSRTKAKPTSEFQTKEALIGDGTDIKALRGFLELNPYICSGCGTSFQSKSEEKPGFLPSDKLQQHRANAETIRAQQESIKILSMAGIEVGSDIAEEVLLAAKVSPAVIRGLKSFGSNAREDKSIDINNEDSVNNVMDETLELQVDSDYYETRKAHYADLQNSKSTNRRSNEDLTNAAVCICQRCYRLQQYGQVEESLRPGWSKNELLTPERFESLLSTIKETEAVVLCIVDVFDLRGSMLQNLKQIAGNNPIVIAANKFDLLPKDVSEVRLTGWIHAEVKEFCGLVSPRDKEEKSTKEFFQRGWRSRQKEGDYEGVLSRTNVHLVSCQSGHGMERLMRDLMNMSMERGNKVFVMGAANVGKSSFINRLLGTNYQNKKTKGKAMIPLATVSNLPGTTLDFIKIRLPNGVTMIDTPGLINHGQLTSRLNTLELKQVIPSKPINAVTLRVSEGKCVLIGGLARVELLDVHPPYFLP